MEEPISEPQITIIGFSTFIFISIYIHVTIHYWEITYLLCVMWKICLGSTCFHLHMLPPHWLVLVDMGRSWVEKGQGGGGVTWPPGSATDYSTQMKHVCHGHADHLVIDESCSYFAQADTLIQRGVCSSNKLLLYVTLRHKWSFKWDCNTIKTL